MQFPDEESLVEEIEISIGHGTVSNSRQLALRKSLQSTPAGKPIVAPLIIQKAEVVRGVKRTRSDRSACRKRCSRREAQYASCECK